MTVRSQDAIKRAQMTLKAPSLSSVHQSRSRMEYESRIAKQTCDIYELALAKVDRDIVVKPYKQTLYKVANIVDTDLTTGLHNVNTSLSLVNNSSKSISTDNLLYEVGGYESQNNSSSISFNNQPCFLTGLGNSSILSALQEYVVTNIQQHATFTLHSTLYIPSHTHIHSSSNRVVE